MGNNTGIEWTDATWNPIRGCSRVSEGCRNCYAERQAHRFSAPGQPYEGLTQIVNGHPAWTGKVALVEKHLLDPLKWKQVWEEWGTLTEGGQSYKYARPRRIFVNSMSDLFHPNVPDEWIAKIVAVMIRAHWHEFQVLTKRPERMQPLLSSKVFWALVDGGLERTTGDKFYYSKPPRNICWGVSVEDQKAADERIPLLLQTPAAVRFISAEPLLGTVQLTRIDLGPGTCGWGKMRKTIDALAGWSHLSKPANERLSPEKYGRISQKETSRLDWVIVGGESGPGARPMHPDWARGLRDQSVAAGVPFFFKQWGEWFPLPHREDLPGRPVMVCTGDTILDEGIPMRCVGKKAAGSLLDGREWKEFPR